VKTVVIQIGNSDDKLSQLEWSEYVREVKISLENYSDEIHFSGGPDVSVAWQNYCFVVTTKYPKSLEADLIEIRKEYRQDSIAIVVSDTRFI